MLMHRRHRRDPAPHVLLGLGRDVLQRHQRLDRLQVVLHPMMDFAEEELVGVERLGQLIAPFGVAVKEKGDPDRDDGKTRGRGNRQSRVVAVLRQKVVRPRPPPIAAIATRPVPSTVPIANDALESPSIWDTAV